MTIQSEPMGAYQTNCYIVSIDGKDIIIDPGVDAMSWVMRHVENPVAILNTHGHFDHVWSNQELKEALNIPLYTPKDDVFLLQNSTFMPELPHSFPDVEVDGDSEITIAGIPVIFRHFPGHCPGCSTIEIGDAMFSGDFIFENSIGRVDFPYSDANAMKESLKRFEKIPYDKVVYPGHGGATSIAKEQRNVAYWLRAI
ncbi:MAG: MBL fold metallo-hydrolase [Sulfurimonas sp.]|nr:MAG: MBL fold metallo-hydrolase [Sulfurimonas sp.]